MILYPERALAVKRRKRLEDRLFDTVWLKGRVRSPDQTRPGQETFGYRLEKSCFWARISLLRYLLYPPRLRDHTLLLLC